MPQFLLRGVLTRWLFAIGLSLSAAIQAANPVTEVYFPDLPKGTVGLGVGVRFSDSPYVGIDDAGSTAHSSSYDLLPYYYYEGDYLFYHGSTAGIHLLDNDSFRLDTLLSYRFDQLESARDDYFRTVEDREQTLEAGFEGAFKGDWGELSLSWVKDAQGRHSGEEIDLGYRFDWHQDEWMLSPFVSYVYQDQNLSNYYYGVSEAESRPDLPAYSADHATILRVGMNTSYQLSPRLRLYANVSIDQLDDTVTASPLVDEDFVPSAMMGVFYEFGSTKNEEALAQSNPERVGEWSWRLNYGYTTESTFNAVHRGDFRRDKDVDTNLLGLTLGKLLLDGDRVDFWGKLFRMTFLRLMPMSWQWVPGTLPGPVKSCFVMASATVFLMLTACRR